MSKIIQAPNPVLNTVSAPVTEFNAALAALADDLHATRQASKGVGLAAPQIGVLERVIALNPGKTVGHRIMVNPEIVRHGNNQSWDDEGCLSIGEGNPRFRVKRWDTITVRFQKLNGETIETMARAEAARIIQHEIDHLNGKLIAPRDDAPAAGRDVQHLGETTMARKIDSNESIKRALNHLAGIPAWGHTTLSRDDARTMLLETGGNMLACGRLYDFVVKDIGAGVCKVSLTPTHP